MEYSSNVIGYSYETRDMEHYFFDSKKVIKSTKKIIKNKNTDCTTYWYLHKFNKNSKLLSCDKYYFFNLFVWFAKVNVEYHTVIEFIEVNIRDSEIGMYRTHTSWQVGDTTNPLSTCCIDLLIDLKLQGSNLLPWT